MIAAVAIRAIGIGTYTDGAKGAGTFIVPQSRISSDSMVVSVSWWGYVTAQSRVLIAPGDTITLAASLCSAPREPVIVRRPVGSPGSPCLGPDDFSQSEVEYFRRFVQSEDSADVVFRRLVQIPAVPDSMVTLVTDGRICHGVVRAWATADSTLGAGPPYVSDLYVMRIGPVFVATIPGGWGSHYQQYVVYDSTFRRLAPFLR